MIEASTVNSVSQLIQLSVAPVFLLAGVAGLLNVFTGRLSRIIDKVDKLDKYEDEHQLINKKDEDILKIISGVLSVVDGISSLRTHASSAHGAGVKTYTLEPRHARLAIHSSHTIALFLLESWNKKQANNKV